jgi:hypothetical protein
MEPAPDYLRNLKWVKWVGIVLIAAFLVLALAEFVSGYAERSRARTIESRLDKVEAFQRAQVQFDELVAEALAIKGQRVKSLHVADPQ